MGTATLLYDSECPFCSWVVGMLVHWDRERRIVPVPLQGADAARLLSDLSPEQRMEAAHVLTPDGVRHSGGDVFAPLLSRLPGGRPLASLAESFPGAARSGYDVASRNRRTLARLIPDRLRGFAARRLSRRQSRG